MIPAKNIINALRGSAKPRVRLQQLRTAYDFDDSRVVVRELSANPFFRRLLGEPFPRSPRLLHKEKPFARVPIGIELGWATALCLQSKTELAAYLYDKGKLESAASEGSLEIALGILDAIDERMGTSLWSIKRRLYLLQHTAGLESQKDFAGRIKAQALPSGIARFVTHYVSVLNEPAVTASRFAAEVSFAIRRSRVPPGLRSYLNYQLIPHLRSEELSLEDVLRWSQQSAVVDLYEATAFALIVIASDPDHSLFGSAAMFAERLAPLGDGRMLQLLAAPIARPAPLSRLLTRAIVAAREGASSLTRGEVPFDEAVILSTRPMAHALLSSGARSSLFSLIADAASAEGTSTDAAASLLKWALAEFPGTNSISVLGLLAGEVGAGATHVREVFHRAAAVMSPTRNLLWMAAVPAAIAQFGRENEEDPILKAYSQIAIDGATDTVAALDGAEARLAASRRLLADGKHVDALRSARDLSTSDVPYFRRWAQVVEVKALLGIGDAVASAQSLVRAVLSNPSWAHWFPLRECVLLARARPSAESAGAIAVPILFELYRQYIDRQADTEVAEACEDYLESIGGIVPSKLQSRIDSEERRLEVVFFLRHVCVESILNRFVAFDNSKDVAEERRAICRVLASLDKSNVDAYHSEIKEITRRLQVRSRMRELEQSKIFVDLSSLRRTLLSELKETFARFEALARVHLDRAEHRQGEGQGGSPSDEPSLLVKGDSADEVFVDIVIRVRDEFSVSSEHGLDKYLSVRVRHGTLAAHLRRPLEAVSLVTSKVPGKGYRRNEVWPSRLFLVAKERDALQARLARFTARFDELVDDLKAILTVARSADDPGLLKFILTVDGIAALQRIVLAKGYTLENLIEELISQFNIALDLGLEDVRENVSTKFKERAILLLDDLEREVEILGASRNVSPLTNAIRSSRTELSVAIARVTEWFRRSSITGGQPFDLEEAIDTCVAAVHPDFAVEQANRGEIPVRFSGDRLNVMIDVLFLVFDNVVRHADLGEHPRATISYRATPIARTTSGREVHEVEVWIDNRLGPAVVAEELVSKVENIRATAAEGRDAMRREGGTGLAKLQRILLHEFGSSSKLSFDVKAESFAVRMSFLKVVENADPTG